MKKLIFLIGLFIITSCSSNSLKTTNTIPIKEYIYIPIQNPNADYKYIQEVVKLRHELELTKDSLNYIRDSLGTDLFVANYKLARIKEYNRIAGQGNNIKYLRGWINRVLEE